MASKHSRSEQDVQPVQTLRIVLVGKTGVGKSATANTILGKKAFESKMSASEVTEKCSKRDGQSGTQYVSIVDTPGLFGKKLMKEALNEMKTCISMSAPGPHVFLIVIQAGRFTPEEEHTVKMIQMTFGTQAQCFTMVLFTGGDNLEAEGARVDELIRGNNNLITFVKQCKGGYHLFNNRVERPTQVTELLRKINEMVTKNGGRNYTDALFKEAEEAITEEVRMIMMKEPGLPEEEARKRAEKDNSFIRKIKFEVVGGLIGGAIGALGGGLGGALAGPVGASVGFAGGATAGGAGGAKAGGSEVRMVLVGQEKVGKSSSGNTIMGRKVFDCSLGFAPVTLKSEKAEGDVFNRRVTVVDTPGLYNSTVSEEQQEAELEEALLLSAPGPHAFLYVVQLGRFTEQERKAMETLERILSSDISHYIMVLFTYGDRLEDTNVEQFIREDENLKKLVDKCGGKYHVFNNKDTGNREQVRKLLDKVSERGYSCYVKAPSAKGDHRTERILGGGAIGLLGGAFVGALGAGVVGAALCAAGGAAVGLYISDKCISYYN